MSVNPSNNKDPVNEVDPTSQATPADSVTPQPSVPRSAFPVMEYSYIFLHPIDAVRQVMQHIQDNRHDRVQVLIDRFIGESGSTLEESVKYILKDDELSLLQKSDLGYFDMRKMGNIEAKYFGKNQLFAEKKATRTSLENLWPKDAEFAVKKMRLIQSKAGRNKVQVLEGISQRKGGWNSLESLVSSFKESKVTYKVNSGIFFNTFEMDEGEEKNYLEFFKDKGILSEKEVALLERFHKNESYLSEKDIKDLKELNNNVLLPLGLAFCPGLQEEAKEYLRPSEIEDIDKIKEKKSLGFFEKRELLAIKNKYFTGDFLSRKVEALRIFKKLYPEQLNEKYHRLLERKNIQNELAIKERVFDRKGEWGGLKAAIDALDSFTVKIKNENEVNDVSFLDHLCEKGIISKSDRQLLAQFNDQSKSANLVEWQRTRLMRVYHERLLPIAQAITESNKDAFKEVVKNQKWFSSWEITLAKELYQAETKPVELKEIVAVTNEEKLPHIIGAFKDFKIRMQSRKEVVEKEFLDLLVDRKILSKDDKRIVDNSQKISDLEDWERARLGKIYTNRLVPIYEALHNADGKGPFKQVVKSKFFNPWDIARLREAYRSQMGAAPIEATEDEAVGEGVHEAENVLAAEAGIARFVHKAHESYVFDTIDEPAAEDEPLQPPPAPPPMPTDSTWIPQSSPEDESRNLSPVNPPRSPVSAQDDQRNELLEAIRQGGKGLKKAEVKESPKVSSPSANPFAGSSMLADLGDKGVEKAVEKSEIEEEEWDEDTSYVAPVVSKAKETLKPVFFEREVVEKDESVGVQKNVHQTDAEVKEALLARLQVQRGAVADDEDDFWED